MKRWVGLGLSALLLLAGIVVVGPYHTLHQLRLAIETRDTARLENQVDFPRLRENIKLQLNDRAAQNDPSPMGVQAASDPPVRMISLRPVATFQKASPMV